MILELFRFLRIPFFASTVNILLTNVFWFDAATLHLSEHVFAIVGIKDVPHFVFRKLCKVKLSELRVRSEIRPPKFFYELVKFFRVVCIFGNKQATEHLGAEVIQLRALPEVRHELQDEI